MNDSKGLSDAVRRYSVTISEKCVETPEQRVTFITLLNVVGECTEPLVGLAALEELDSPLRNAFGMVRGVVELVRKPIARLNFSRDSRIRALLFSACIETIDDLIGHSEEDLLRIEGLGKNALGDVKAALEEVGLALASTHVRSELEQTMIDLLPVLIPRKPS